MRSYYVLRINISCLHVTDQHNLHGCYSSLMYIFTSIHLLGSLRWFSIGGCRIPVIGPSNNWIWPEWNDWMAYLSFLQALGPCTHFRLTVSATRHGRPNAKASKLVMCFGGVAFEERKKVAFWDFFGWQPKNIQKQECPYEAVHPQSVLLSHCPSLILIPPLSHTLSFFQGKNGICRNLGPD